MAELTETGKPKPNSLEWIAERLFGEGPDDDVAFCDLRIARLIVEAIRRRHALVRDGIRLRDNVLAVVSAAGAGLPVRSEFPRAVAAALVELGVGFVVPESLSAPREAWPRGGYVSEPFDGSNHPRTFTQREITALAPAALLVPNWQGPLVHGGGAGAQTQRPLRDWAVAVCRVLDAFYLVRGSLFYYADRYPYTLDCRTQHWHDAAEVRAHENRFDDLPLVCDSLRKPDEEHVPTLHRVLGTPDVIAHLYQDKYRLDDVHLEQSLSIIGLPTDVYVVNTATVPARLWLWSYASRGLTRKFTAFVGVAIYNEHQEGPGNYEAVEVETLEVYDAAADEWHLVERHVTRNIQLSVDDSPKFSTTFEYWRRSWETGEYVLVDSGSLDNPKRIYGTGYSQELALCYFDTFDRSGRIPGIGKASRDPAPIEPGGLRDLYSHLVDPKVRDGETFTPTQARPIPGLPTAANRLYDFFPAFSPADYLEHLPAPTGEPQRRVNATFSLQRVPILDYSEALTVRQDEMRDDFGILDPETEESTD